MIDKNNNTIKVETVTIGASIDTRSLRKKDFIAPSPLTFEASDGGYWVVFRFGVVVFFNISQLMRTSIIEELSEAVVGPNAEKEVYHEIIAIDPEGKEYVKSGNLYVQNFDIARLQVIATAYARNAALDLYEKNVAKRMDVIGSVAEQLKSDGAISFRSNRRLIKSFGEGLAHQSTMLGQIEAVEKPELLWERGDLEPLFHLLEDEYELKERYQALEQKYRLMTETAESIFHIGGLQRSLRVEWYIVILILIELGMNIWDLL